MFTWHASMECMSHVCIMHMSVWMCVIHYGSATSIGLHTPAHTPKKYYLLPISGSIYMVFIYIDRVTFVLVYNIDLTLL